MKTSHIILKGAASVLAAATIATSLTACNDFYVVRPMPTAETQATKETPEDCLAGQSSAKASTAERRQSMAQCDPEYQQARRTFESEEKSRRSDEREL